MTPAHSTGRPTHAALLRGINVGGRARVPMATLREVATGLGLTDVRTIANSGNLLFSCGEHGAGAPAEVREPAPDKAPQLLERALERALEDEVGFAPPVIVRSLPELADVAAALRRAFHGAEATKLVGVFLSEPPRADVSAAFADFPEDVRTAGNDLIVHYVNGQARSKLDPARLERILGVAIATARGVNTIEKLAGST